MFGGCSGGKRVGGGGGVEWRWWLRVSLQGKGGCDVGGCKRDEHEKHAQEGAFLVFGGLFRWQEGLLVVVASNGDGGGMSRCRGKAARW